MVMSFSPSTSSMGGTPSVMVLPAGGAGGLAGDNALDVRGCAMVAWHGVQRCREP
jgi:hypothetical protein